MSLTTEQRAAERAVDEFDRATDLALSHALAAKGCLLRLLEALAPNRTEEEIALHTRAVSTFVDETVSAAQARAHAERLLRPRV